MVNGKTNMKHVKMHVCKMVIDAEKQMKGEREIQNWRSYISA
jgi:hypothetical protein